jgi:hypothetical protein
VSYQSYAATEDQNDDVKDSFYEELECIFHKDPKCHKKSVLGIQCNCNAEVGKEDIFEEKLEMKICTELILEVELE